MYQIHPDSPACHSSQQKPRQAHTGAVVKPFNAVFKAEPKPGADEQWNAGASRECSHAERAAEYIGA